MATVNIYEMAQTWNNGAVAFTAIGMNVTDTASDAASLLMDLQVGGASKFKVDKDGAIYAGHATKRFEITSPYDFRVTTGSYFDFVIGTTAKMTMRDFGLGLDVLGFGRATAYPTRLTFDGFHILAQRNGANAQTFNIYNTYTDASNYERGFLKWNSNVLEIGTEANGTGTARSVRIVGSTSNDLSVFGSSSASMTLRSGTLPGTVRTSMFAGFGAGVVATETAHPLILRSQNVERVRLDTTGSVQIVTALTIATLPGTPAVGMIARVTDGDSGLTFGNTVVNSGAGATPYLVWYNGTNWTVIGA